MEWEATYPASQLLRGHITVAGSEDAKKFPGTTRKQTVVVGHDHYILKLLQYAWFTGCTVLSGTRVDVFQHIFTNVKAGLEHGAVLA